MTRAMQAARLTLRRCTSLASDSPNQRSCKRLSKHTAYLRSVTTVVPQPCYQGIAIRRTSSNSISSSKSTFSSRLSSRRSSSPCNSCRDGLWLEDPPTGQRRGNRLQRLRCQPLRLSSPAYQRSRWLGFA